MIYRLGVDGYIADNQFRKRDPRFIYSTTYKEQQAKCRKERGNRISRFIPADFDSDPVTETCRCPAGITLAYPAIPHSTVIPLNRRELYLPCAAGY